MFYYSNNWKIILARGKNVQNQIFKILGGSMTPKKKLKIMLELSDRLNGKCSMNLSTCPSFIELDNMINTWICDDCVNMFKGIVDIYALARAELGIQYPPCPCKWVPDIAITRLEEYIEELKQEVSR